MEPEDEEKSDADLRTEREAERKEKIRCQNVTAGMVQCSLCNSWFYDVPGNFCSHS